MDIYDTELKVDKKAKGLNSIMLVLAILSSSSRHRAPVSYVSYSLNHSITHSQLKKRVSMKDIAEAAGVSTALVSYVLNGKEKESRVGEEMAKKIKVIARELNYQPNHVAKSLRSGKTHTIGLIIADISNPFFANIARVVEDEAKRSGYTVIIGSCDENAINRGIC